MTEFISEDDIDQTVKVIVESLNPNIEGYIQASQLYDSIFFEGENPSFTRKLASALFRKYKKIYHNSYWKKLAGEENG